MNPKKRIAWWVIPVAILSPALLTTLVRFLFDNDSKKTSIAYACLTLVFTIVILLILKYKMKKDANVAYKYAFIFIFAGLIFMAGYTLFVYKF